MSRNSTTHDSPRAFPQTRWSVVMAARLAGSAQSTEALETLCRAYWYPLYTYVRRSGQSAHNAQDLTQGFFSCLLEKRWLDTVDPAKGRLRTFLIVALKHFMSKEWRQQSAQKRGGGATPIPIDSEFAEGIYAADSSSLPADEAYDRQWALNLLTTTMDCLRAEFAGAGKAGDFDILKGCLLAERGGIDYATLARGLGVNEGAARVAAHRLRKRFREIYRQQVSLTLAKDDDVEEEIRHLAAALSHSSTTGTL